MACLFCKSSFHLTQNCGIYSCDKSRKEFCVKNEICQTCLSSSYIDSNKICGCKYTKSQKCYTCFSKNHSSVFCKIRKEFDLFIPKIDADLQPRFSQTLNCIEKYSLTFSSPKYSNFFKPKGIIVTPSIEKNEIIKYHDKDIIFGNRIYSNCFVYADLQLKLANFAAPRICAIQPKVVNLIWSGESFSVECLFQLLSFYTQKLKCANVEFDSAIKFSEILSKIPNIREIELANTNIVIEKSWPEDLLKFKKGNNFVSLFLKIDNFDFDFRKLKEFMKKNNKNHLRITLDIDQKEFEPTLYQILIKKIYEHFVNVPKLSQSILTINHTLNTPLSESEINRKFMCTPV